MSINKTLISLFLVFLFVFLAFLPTEIPKVNAAVIFQEGFEGNLNLWEINRPDNVIISSDAKHEGQNALRIRHDGLNWGSNASRRFSSPLGGRVAVWIYDDLSSPSAYVYLSVSNDDYTSGTSIGIRPQTSTQNYVYCPTENQAGCMDTGHRRTRSWHQFKIFATPKGTYGKIDGVSFSYLPANEVNGAVNVNFTQLQRVNLGIMNGTSGYFYFDDVYVDSYPPPPSDTEIAMSFVNLFLTTYPTIDVANIDRMIKARESDFCSVDTQPCPDGSGKSPHWHYNEQLFHVYGALLQTAGAHAVNYLKNNQASSLQKTIEIITYIDGEYDRWKQNKSGSIVGSLMTTVSWIIWPHLPVDLQQSIRTHMPAEGEYFKNVYQPYSEYIGNSSGEENSWPAMYLNALSLAFKDLPQAQSWSERAKFFAFHSLSKNESYGGFTSRTIYDDNLFDNHGYHPHPTYGMGTAATLAAMEYLSEKVVGSAPTEFRHNVLPVWQRLKEYIDFRNFSYKGEKISPPGAFYPSGQNDWGDDALTPFWYRVMKEVYGDNAVSDPETGFSTSDISRHSMEYLYYTHSGYVWRYDPPNTQLTEMLIDQGFAHPFPNWQDVTSYKWWRNSQWAWSYAYLVLIFDPDFTFPSYVPNCSNVSGPSSLVLGNSGTYSADFSSAQGNLAGEIFYNNLNRIEYKSLSGNSGSFAAVWTPPSAGAYQVCCRAWNDGIAECRPPSLVDGPPRYSCQGPGYCTTVNVITPTPTPTPPPLPGDINKDGTVNILDYQLLSNAFGTADSNADLNKDGTVNILDFQILSNNFGR